MILVAVRLPSAVPAALRSVDLGMILAAVPVKPAQLRHEDEKDKSLSSCIWKGTHAPDLLISWEVHFTYVAQAQTFLGRCLAFKPLQPDFYGCHLICLKHGHIVCPSRSFSLSLHCYHLSHTFMCSKTLTSPRVICMRHHVADMQALDIFKASSNMDFRLVCTLPMPENWPRTVCLDMT